MRMHFLYTDIESSLPRHIHLENVYEIRFLEFFRLNSYIKIQIVLTMYIAQNNFSILLIFKNTDIQKLSISTLKTLDALLIEQGR